MLAYPDLPLAKWTVSIAFGRVSRQTPPMLTQANGVRWRSQRTDRPSIKTSLALRSSLSRKRSGRSRIRIGWS